MKVPTFQVQSQRTSEPNTSPLQAKANPNILAGPQNALKDFADTAFKISSDFYKQELKLRDERQLSEASNGFAEGLNLASIEANKETDIGNIRPKFDELTADLMIQQSNTITSKALRGVFESKGKSLLTNYNININNQVRTKEIKKTFGEKIIEEKRLIEEAINGNKAQQVTAFDSLFGNQEKGVTGLYDGMSGNLMDPGDAFNRSETVRKTIAKQRIVNQFNAQPNIETKRAFVEGLTKNPPKALMPSTVDEITRKLTNIIDVNISKANTLKNITSKEEMAKLLSNIVDGSVEELQEQFELMGDFSPEDLLLTVGDFTQAQLTLESRIRFLENQAKITNNKKMAANLGDLQLKIANAGNDEEKIKSILEEVKEIDPSVSFLKSGQIAAIQNRLQEKIKFLGKENSVDALNTEKANILRMQINGDIAGLNELLLSYAADDDAMRDNAGSYLSTLAALNSSVNQLKSNTKSAAGSLQKELNQFVSSMKDGFEVNENQFTSLEKRAADLGDYGQNLQVKINQAKDLNSKLSTMRKMSPSQLEVAISSIQGGVVSREETPDGEIVTTPFGGEGPNTQYEQNLIKASQTLLSQMKTQLKNDPLSWASRVGITDQPIGELFFDPGNLPQTAQSIGRRVAQAEQIADYYGLAQATYLTPGERFQLTDVLYNGNKETRLGLMNMIVNGFGAEAPDVLGEISKNGREFAHIGGLMNLGNRDAVELALDGMDIKKAGGVAIDFTTSNYNITWINEVGSALSADVSMNNDLASGRKIAEHIYMALANRGGFQTFDDDVYSDAVQMAFGGDPANGTGGIQEVRREQTLIPPGFTGDMVEDAMANISQNYLLSKAYNVDSALLKEIKGGRISSGPWKIIAVGNGMYQFRKSLGHSSNIAEDLNGNIIEIQVFDLIEFQEAQKKKTTQ